MTDAQAAVRAALESPAAYPHETRAIRIIETHISTVYLTGPFAYKVKKPVTFSFLDFSTLDLREQACRDELRLNRRLAPAIYLDVVGIGGEAGKIEVGGQPVHEYAVRMKQFAPGSTAHELIRDDALTAAELIELATRIAEFHGSLAPETGSDPVGSVRANLTDLEASCSEAMQPDVSEIGDWMRSTLSRLEPLLAARGRAGFVRECHGDLHLGNIVRWEGELVPFDCLEFSKPLRTLDVIDEAAFLFMDLLAHQRSDLAFSFLNRYLGITGDYAGVELLRLYVAHRALVRAKVAIASPRELPVPHTEQQAARYLGTALAQVRAPTPLCVITMGYSGSGKTTIARQLAPELGAAHVRSDVERKRLHGLGPTADSHSELDQGIYDTASSKATYARLAAAANAALAGSVNVILDAAFLSRSQRDLIRSTAAGNDARFLILECRAPDDVLRQRIQKRNETRSDASEADLAVLDHQLTTASPIDDDEKAHRVVLETGGAIDAGQLAAEIRARCAQPSLSSTSY
ncbi:MAG: AAA family ATPase [Gammaproteobacteria bacterium]|jgi:aminoglycoside phosphotransferase family enzyme/predicted kinase